MTEGTYSNVPMPTDNDIIGILSSSYEECQRMEYMQELRKWLHSLYDIEETKEATG